MHSVIPYQLRQRGRAGMEFLQTVSKLNGALRPRIAEELTQAGVTNETLPEDLDARLAFVDERMTTAPAWRLNQAANAFVSGAHGRVALQAFEDIRSEVEPELRRLEAVGPATLTENPALKAPAYYQDVWFHGTEGGWSGHPQQGFIHGELVHSQLVAKAFGGDIFAMRRAMLGELPHRDFADIFEMGTSSGHYTTALQQAFPNARIVGSDLSAPMLRQALRVANTQGWTWDLRQLDAEKTELPDAAFDLVTAYSFLHELPAATIPGIFAEAHRLLRPDGYVLMGDVTPYGVQDKLSVWRADQSAATGGEPYWREVASLDWAKVARDAGFQDVRTVAMNGAAKFPFVVVGRRP